MTTIESMSSRLITYIISIAAMSAMLMMFFASCQSNHNGYAQAIDDRSSFPILSTDSVNTLISDSGVVRYRIVAPRWSVYDKAKEPYWFFPRGFYFEKFDSLQHVDAMIESDTAWYFENKQLWHLRGNVKVKSLAGEYFETQELFWSQPEERIYSDKFIRIEQKTSIITGLGFQSNQSLTKYTIVEPQGIFPISEEPDTTQTQSNQP